MTNEELLKSISDMLKAHEDYLNENPDIFLGIQDRFLDAISYGSEDLTKAEDNRSGFFSPEDIENIKDMDLDQAKKYLSNRVSDKPNAREHNTKNALNNIKSAQSIDALGANLQDSMLAYARKDKRLPKSSKSGYRDWQPRDDYSPEQQAKIKEHMDEGWSHREAERFANAHQGPKDFSSALDHRVNPSQPSSKMLDTMKEYALEYKQRANKREGENADAGINPQKFASHQDIKAHEEAYGDYDKDYKSFLKDLDEKDLHPLEYDEAVSKWQDDWHKQNPEAKDKMVAAADAGKVYGEANQARSEKLDEGRMSLIQGGNASGESSTGEFSDSASAGNDADNSMQTAAQMVGGAKGEGGYEAGTVKDPNAIFREQNPEFVAQLKQKLASKLGQNPEAKERHDAMPPRARMPKEQQPGAVKRLTPEEIQAQYGDKYNVKKPGGVQ